MDKGPGKRAMRDRVKRRARMSVEHAGKLRCEHCFGEVHPREAVCHLREVVTSTGKTEHWCKNCIKWGHAQLQDVRPYQLKVGPGTPDLIERRAMERQEAE